MHPNYFGDSYDIVKRFFCAEISVLGYEIRIDPLFTGDWSDKEIDQFFRLVGVNRHALQQALSAPTALFLDPDTGVHRRHGPKHVSLDRIADDTMRHALVFSFDQSFSRQSRPLEVMSGKLDALSAKGVRGLYYDSHARFLFASRSEATVNKLRQRLIETGIPERRLLQKA